MRVEMAQKGIRQYQWWEIKLNHSIVNEPKVSGYFHILKYQHQKQKTKKHIKTKTNFRPYNHKDVNQKYFTIYKPNILYIHFIYLLFEFSNLHRHCSSFNIPRISPPQLDLRMKKQAQLANDLKKLQYQLSYSQHINRQLSQQLALVCEQSGLSIKRLKSPDNIPEINYNKMLQELYYVEPLLMAYQHKISLYQQQLEEVQQESQSLEKYAEQLVKQNDFLRKQLKRKNDFILISQQIGINMNFMKLDNDALTQKNKILLEKNTYLTEKLKQLSKTIDTLKKSNQTEMTLNKLQKQIQRQVEQKKHLELEIANLQAKIQIISNQCNNEKAMNKQYERKLSDLENDLSKWKNETKIYKQQLQTTTMNNQHTKQNLEAQLESIKTQLTISQRRENQLFNKTMLLQNELNQKSSKLHNLTLQSTQLQTNNNNLLQMLENYESKVSQLNKKIKLLEQQNKQDANTYTENRKQLEIAQWKLSQKIKQLERKDLQFRKEKQRITKLWQDRIQVMRNAFEQQKDRIYDDLKVKNTLAVK